MTGHRTRDVATLEEPSVETTLDLHTRGCPVCNWLAERMFDFFAKWQYALSSDESAQAAFAAAGGFCPLHTWQLVAMASPQGLSVGLPVLMDRLSRDLSNLAAPASADIIVASHCAACQFLASQEQVGVSHLADIIRTEPGLALYRKSQGLCLPHLRRLLAMVDRESLRSELIALAARWCGEWAEDMQNYAMKRDAIRRALLNKDEEEAYYRAIVHLAGARALCYPAQEETYL